MFNLSDFGDIIVITAKCPHCNKEKKLVQLVSGNTFGSTLWSDAKRISPMFQINSPVQKCPFCGHYFMLSQVETGEEEGRTNETGWLSFNELLEAAKEITPRNDEEFVDLSIVTIWSFNDIYRKRKEPTDEQKKECQDSH